MLQILVTLHPNGKLELKGFDGNKIAALGMLELAKKVILDFNPAEAAKGIEVPDSKTSKVLLAPGG